MPIVFSKHALEQIKRRKISRRKVIETIRHSRKKAVSFRERILRRKEFDDKLLEVSYKNRRLTNNYNYSILSGGRINMKMKYDKKIDAMYIELAKGKYSKTRKISDSVLVDEDVEGKPLGIEILDATKNISAFDPKKTHISIQ